jgi:predicted CXXCH cytochrome family protein
MRSKSGVSGLFGKMVYVLILSFLFAQGNVFATTAKSVEDCIDCHADVWRDLSGKTYVHRPEGNGDCKYCHVPVREGIEKGGKAYLDNIKWVARGVNPSKEHRLEFEDAKRGATLLVEARSGSHSLVKEFPLPEFGELEELRISGQVPPTISNVRLLGATRGVFVSATIAWETDSPADSQVIYGFDKLDHTSMLDSQPVTNHVVILTGVQPGKIYKYKVVSVDLAGNRVESATKSLAVENIGSESQDSAGKSGGKINELKVSCYRHGNKSFVIVTADQAVSVRLGIMPKKYVEVSSGDQPTVIRHLPLNTPAVTNIGICYSCHVEYEKILSHPVNVYPKRGMVIPPEYTTLPDGRITCMSCHANHASNIEFRLIKDRKEELCRGCHQNLG